MLGRRLRVLSVLGLLALLAVGGWRLRTRRDADHDLGPGKPKSSQARAPRLTEGTGTTSTDADGNNQVAGTVEGVVSDGQGKPVDGARVAAERTRGRHEVGSPASEGRPQGRGEAITAGGGRFRIEGLIPGDYAVVALSDAQAPGHRSPVLVTAGGTTHVELALGPAGVALSGRILDAGGGGVGGARVMAIARALSVGRPSVAFPVTAGRDGRYRLVLSAGPYGLRVEADGYAPALVELFVARGTTQDVRLVPAARVAGRVVERPGEQALAGAEVLLTSVLPGDLAAAHAARSGAGGHFELTGLGPGRYELTARRGPLASGGRIIALYAGQFLDGVEVELGQGLAVGGRVRGDGGAGLANVQVSAVRETPPFAPEARTRTGSDGGYLLEGLLPGRYRLSARAEGYGSGRATAQLRDADLSSVDIMLPAAIAVNGRVVAPDGRPVEGARVQARSATSARGRVGVTGAHSVLSAPDGSFHLDGIAPGQLRIDARHPEHGTAAFGPQEVRASESRSVQLVLAPGGSIEGQVRTDDGRPAPGVRVAAFAADLRAPLDAQDLSGPDGRYRLFALPPGRIAVVADRGGPRSFASQDLPHQRTVPLGEGEAKSGVDLVVDPAGLELRGVALSPEGQPVAGALVTVTPERAGPALRSSTRATSGVSDRDGHFLLENLGRGSHTLRAVHPEHPDAVLARVSPAAAPVEVRFPASAAISGVVVSAAGDPVPDYTVALLPAPTAGARPEPRGRPSSNDPVAPLAQVQDRQGLFQLRQVPEGTHQVAITTAGGESGATLVTVQAGEHRRGIRIQVRAGLRISGRVLEHGSDRPLAGIKIAASTPSGARSEDVAGPDGRFTLTGPAEGDTLRLAVLADPTRHVPEWKQLPVKAGQTELDAGTIWVLPGNHRERASAPAPQRGHIGAALSADGGRAVLAGLRPGGPAQRAGLRSGDLMLSIDGVDTRQLGSGALGYLVTGRPGTSVTLAVERPGGGARSVTLTREASALR
jgi:protocatechuate 3,4-dioxygenase beta subunit